VKVYETKEVTDYEINGNLVTGTIKELVEDTSLDQIDGNIAQLSDIQAKLTKYINLKAELEPKVDEEFNKRPKEDVV